MVNLAFTRSMILLLTLISACVLVYFRELHSELETAKCERDYLKKDNEKLMKRHDDFVKATYTIDHENRDLRMFCKFLQAENDEIKSILRDKGFHVTESDYGQWEDKISDSKWLDQEIKIESNTYYNSYEFTNNTFLEDHFTQSYIGTLEHNTYDVLLEEDGILQFYDYLTPLLSYNGIRKDDDSREDVETVYKMISEIILEGELRGAELLYTSTEGEA